METVIEQERKEKTSRKKAPLEQENLDSQLSSVQTNQDQKTNFVNHKEPTTMNKVHTFLNKKGGIGKSFAASILAQYLFSTGESIVAVDTDPSNATLFGYKALNGRRVKLMEGTVLNEGKFDLLMNDVLQEDSNFVIDCGASSFIPLSNYMIEMNAAAMIAESGKEMVAHTVIVGQSNLMDTLTSFAEIVEQLPEEVRVVVWLNEFFGKIEVDGKPFEEMSVYLNNQDRIQGIVYLPERSKMFNDDIEKMITLRLTFDEVRQSPEFFIMNKSRIHRVQKDIYSQLDVVM